MFQQQALAVARGMGFPGINLALYPGAIETHSEEELNANIAGLFSVMVKAWTETPEQAKVATQSRPTDVVLKGFALKKGSTKPRFVTATLTRAVGQNISFAAEADRGYVNP